MPDEALFCRDPSCYLVVITVYVGTYIWLRASHVERWDRDGHDYVLLPQSSLVYYVYRRLTY
jgi:hypothetical protein